MRAIFAVPAELGANWLFQASWTGEIERYMAGVRRALSLGIVIPLLAPLAPLHALLWGSRVAAAHLACGWLASLVAIELLFLGFRKLPFTCSYVPGNARLKTRWPAYLVAFGIYTYGFPQLESAALATAGGLELLLGALLLAVGSLIAYRHWPAGGRPAIVFEEAPEAATQALGLSG